MKNYMIKPICVKGFFQVNQMYKQKPDKYGEPLFSVVAEWIFYRTYEMQFQLKSYESETLKHLKHEGQRHWEPGLRKFFLDSEPAPPQYDAATYTQTSPQLYRWSVCDLLHWILLQGIKVNKSALKNAEFYL